jgi:hypothetical protein
VEYLLSEYDFARYVYKLLDSKLFAANKEYVRRQILYCLLQVSQATTPMRKDISTIDLRDSADWTTRTTTWTHYTWRLQYSCSTAEETSPPLR